MAKIAIIGIIVSVCLMRTCSSLRINVVVENQDFKSYNSNRVASEANPPNHIQRSTTLNASKPPKQRTRWREDNSHNKLNSFHQDVDSELFTPLEIIVDGINWKQLAGSINKDTKAAPSETHPMYPVWKVERAKFQDGKADYREKTSVNVEVEKMSSEELYALDILNQQMPEDLKTCYDNMTNKALEREVHSPAAYGDRLCGNLQSAESCAERMDDKRSRNSSLRFIESMKQVRSTLCDPECPFAQVESCKTKIVTSMKNTSDQPCRVMAVVSCIDTMLTELKCKANSAALVYWLRNKMLTQLQYCDSQPEKCINDVVSCLQPLEDYAMHLDITTLCRKQKILVACLAADASRSCNIGELATNIFAAIKNELENHICS